MQNNIKLTKEQHEQLKPYEKQITAAYKNSFLHMSGTDFIKVAEIYKDVYSQELKKSQMGCNTCRLNALRKLGQLYEEYEKGVQEKKKERKKKLGEEENG